MNCCVPPTVMEVEEGVIESETRLAAVAVALTTADPVMPPEVAWMVALPAALAVARPEVEIVAIEVLLDTQVAEEVRVFVDPSL